mmetsp:Transcript_1880/g.4166  ORF Transcript_1880/g.4166 Transcript_1880/m.4166 type:complete len:143 (-) Transcript_1880:127-555(-)
MYFGDEVSSALAVSEQNWNNEDALLDIRSVLFQADGFTSFKSNSIKDPCASAAQVSSKSFSQGGLAASNAHPTSVAVEDGSCLSSYVIDKECCWSMLDRLHGAICPESNNNKSVQDKAKAWEMLDNLHASLYPNGPSLNCVR